MHRLIIHKLGPIQHCEIEISQIMTLTGFQASGKSTIAKAIYYFRTVKDDLFSIAENRALNYADDSEDVNISFHKALTNKLREKFLRVFGSSWSMDGDMYLEYHYTDNCMIKVFLREDDLYSSPNYVWVELNREISNFLKTNSNPLSCEALGIPDIQKKEFKAMLRNLFDDEFEVVYIPAGRSILTLLSQQLSYIYTTMKDSQKRTLDYCTQDYIERILQLKSEFSEGLEGTLLYYGTKNDLSKDTIKLALNLTKKVLKGNYVFSNGEERIMLTDNKYVKINFASSGQQESVWILNLLFYYLVKNKPTLFIIEEPESNLFPESQKYITELISLVGNRHSVFITTHSPYVLGTLNNLLYANQVPAAEKGKASEIIPQPLWLDYHKFNAWFVKDGIIEDCMDDELNLIQNERIDEISKV